MKKTDARKIAEAITNLQQNSDVDTMPYVMLTLFHGTNRKIKNLRIDSFLTTKFEEAEHFAHLKDGGIVCEFLVNKSQIAIDNGSPIVCEWYLSNEKLQPVFYHSV